MDLIESFPWATLPESIHRILAHAPEMVMLNEGCGLGELSEEALEGMHKKLRRIRSSKARTNDLQANIRDTWTLLWLQSDPVIKSHSPCLECSYCGEAGHTVRKHRGGQEGVQISSDDKIVASYFL